MYNQPNKNIIILTDNIFTKFTVHKPPVQSFGTKKKHFHFNITQIELSQFQKNV